jgi:Ca2+-binding RTX toxin-like protein
MTTLEGRRVAVAASICLAAVTLVPLPAMAASSSSTPTCHGRPATLVGTDGPDDLVGTRGVDVIVARRGRDVIEGRGGDDVICGGSGQDRIVGGPGADVLRGNQDGDTLHGNGGDDVLIGGGGADTFPHANTLWGGPGDDVYVARSRFDILTWTSDLRPGRPVDVDLRAGTATGEGHDTIRSPNAGAGPRLGLPPGSTAFGTAADESFLGRDLVVHTGGGNDQVYGTGTIDAGAGNDRVEIENLSNVPLENPSVVKLGTGDDSVSIIDDALMPGTSVDGGPGTNVFRVYRSQDDGSFGLDLATGQLTMGSGSASVVGFTDADLTLPSPESVELDGTDGPNRLDLDLTSGAVTVRGRGGDDVISTGSGDDTVDGGWGDDTADTRAGTDTCVSVEAPTNCENVSP